jgi:pentapeptide MXKDX repeat protein
VIDSIRTEPITLAPVQLKPTLPGVSKSTAVGIAFTTRSYEQLCSYSKHHLINQKQLFSFHYSKDEITMKAKLLCLIAGLTMASLAACSSTPTVNQASPSSAPAASTSPEGAMKGDAMKGDAMKGDAKGDAMKGDAMKGDAKGDAMKGDAMKGDAKGGAMKSDAMKGDAMKKETTTKP